MKFLEHGKDYAPAFLRYGLALVFFYFGIRQITDPANYIGYLPEFLFFTPYAQQIVIANGISELILGLLLVLGLFTRIVAFILAIHLAAITIELGFDDSGARDFGLTVACLVTVLFGPDKYCLDNKWKK